MLEKVVRRVAARAGLVSARDIRDLQRRVDKAERAVVKADDWAQRRAKQAVSEASGKEDQKWRERARLAAERLPEIERTAVHVREQLMAVEVKLDIIEGAITVLDARTRAALAAAEERGGRATETLAAAQAEQADAGTAASLDGMRRAELPTPEAVRAEGP